MDEKEPLSPADLTRQVNQHLESLRVAGIEWIPTASVMMPLHPTPQASPSLALPQVDSPAIQTGLFAAGSPLQVVGDHQHRLDALMALKQQVSGCMRCAQLASTRTQTVFGVGPLDPDLCFVGEAPGADEDRLGEPFVGAAGQLLDRIIVACGMKREEVFICNILRCRPPGNRQPQIDEAEHCKEWLERTIDLVRPRFLCALGGTAVTHLLGITQGITRIRGKFFEYRGIPTMCTFHPSYLLRSPEKKREVWEDMKTLLARMGKPIPSRGG